MQSLLRVAAALCIFASATVALKLYNARQEQLPCVHLLNLVGKIFEVSQPGDYPLLRVPSDSTQPALVHVRGSFRENEHAPCCLYMDTVAITGEWLGNLTVHVASWNGSFTIKVSSSSPAFAGSMRSIESFIAPTKGQETFPKTFKVEKTTDGNPSFKFYLGPKNRPKRPVMIVAQGLREGLDVSLLNMSGFRTPSLAGLLGTESHDNLLEAHTEECQAHVQRMWRHPGASDLFTSWSVQPTQLQNLAGESFEVNQPGDYELLRVPKDKKQPVLVQARGTFLAGDNESCVVFLSRVSLGGTWFAGKTVHVASLNGSFGLKVSSADPKFAGKWRGVETFTAITSGPEALPDTVQVKTAVDGPTFKFRVGPKEEQKQATILITQALHGGLEVALSVLTSINATEMAGLLGTEKHAKALDVRTVECEAGLQRLSGVPAGSSLSASWEL